MLKNEFLDFDNFAEKNEHSEPNSLMQSENNNKNEMKITTSDCDYEKFFHSNDCFKTDNNNNNIYLSNNHYNDKNNNYKDNDDYNCINENRIDEIFSLNDNNSIEQNDKVTNIKENINTITLNTGKIINTINPTMSIIMNDLFNTDKIDYENKNDMQLLKIKKKRRTNSEILNEKNLKLEEKTEAKKPGRYKKKETINLENNINNNSDNVHSKKADDNILKKVNTFFCKNIRKWLNNSFIDDNYNFLSNQNKFLKMKQKLKGFTNLKKKETKELMKMKFKDIFNIDISIKYKKNSTNYNKCLINNIYSENKQYFVIFILELTFIDAFNIFIGQTQLNDIKQLFKNTNINEKTIDLFYEKFDKIDIFLKKIYEEEKLNKSKEDIKDYLERICILCSNYENWFDRKYDRKPNKSNKKEDQLLKVKNNKYNDNFEFK